MKKTTNKVTVIGRIHNHNLVERVTGAESKMPGVKYIAGSVDIATDEKGINVIPVYFTFVTAEKKYDTYNALKRIMDGDIKTVVTHGLDYAEICSISGSVEVNDFYTERGGEETLVTAKRIGASFINLGASLVEESKRVKFSGDILITSSRIVEADEERHIDKDYMVVGGYMFDWRGGLIPVEFSVKDEANMRGIESMEITNANPAFLDIREGTIINQTTVITKEEPCLFGEPIISEVVRNHREWVIKKIKAEEDYKSKIGDAVRGITVEDMKKAQEDRTYHLADVKRRREKQLAKRAERDKSSVAAAASDGFFF